MANEGIEVEIYHYTDWTEVKGILPGRKGPKFLDEMKGVGGGEFLIARADPKLKKDPTLLDGRNICKLKVDGEVVGAFLFGDRESTLVSANERADIGYKIAGSGLKQLFDDSIVESPGGTKRYSSSVRAFNFAAEQGSWYKSSSWINPIAQGTIKNHPTYPVPKKWPSKVLDAQWIWGSARLPVMPFGTCYFRYTLNIASAGRYAIYTAADDVFELYVNGEQIAKSNENSTAWKEASRVEVQLNAGQNIIAYAAYNLNAPDYQGPAALASAIMKVSTSGKETVVGKSQVSGWKVLPYPAEAPGWSPGEVLGDLLKEAAARNVVFASRFTRTFTDTHDSNGVPWPEDIYTDWVFDNGESLLSVVTKLEEATVDIWVDPDTFELHMVPQRGVDRTIFDPAAGKIPVDFKLGKHLKHAATEAKSKIKNHLLLKTAEGFFGAEDTASKSKYGRLESLLDTGSTSKLSKDIAKLIFKQRAQEEEGASYELILNDYQPFVDFNIGDWVWAPNERGERAKRRIMSISVEENDGGKPIYTIEFDTIFRANEDRINRVLGKMGAGGVGSNYSNVSGSTPGVGQPIIISPTEPVEGTTGQIPKAPTDLVVVSEGAWTPNGVTPISVAQLDWAAVTQDIDDEPMTPVYYQIEGQLFGATDDGNGNIVNTPLADPIDYGRVTENTATLQPFTPGQLWRFRVRAGDEGYWSDWSTPAFETMEAPNTPPPAPNAPEVSSHRGTLTIDWDGLMGDYQPPPQFRYVYAEIANDEAGPWQRVGQVLFRGGGTITVPQLSVGNLVYTRLLAVDGVGLVSDPSPSVAHTVTGIVGPDIEANSVDANVIIAGSIKTNHLSPEVGNELVLDGNVTIIATQEQIAGVATDLDSTNDNLAVMQTYYDFGPDGAIISSPGSVFATAVRSDRIEMLENGNVLSYWNSGQMYVDQLIGRRVTLGRHQIEQFDANGTVVRAL